MHGASIGVLEVDEVAALTLDCVERGEFLVLPHREVLGYVQRKASDTTRWVRRPFPSWNRFHIG